MSFKVKLYTFSKKINSTAQPTGGTDFDCFIKSPSSIMNPVIELNSNPMAYNYAYISDFSRYYFINDIRFDKGLWICSLNVDVLATYKSTIGSTSTYVLRAANGQNQYLSDNMFPITGKSTITNTTISTGAYSYNSGYYLITTTGTSNANGKNVYQLSPSDFKTFISNLFTTADGYNWGDLTRGIINSIMNPLEYISSVVWFPEAFATSGTEEIKCGLWGSGITADIVDTTYSTIAYTVSLAKHPQAATYGKYCNMEPFSRYTIVSGFTGAVALDATKMIDAASIYVSIARDPITGMARITGTTSSDSHYLFSISTMYGVPIPMTQVSTNFNGAISEGLKTATAFVEKAYLESAAHLGNALSAAIGTVSSRGSQGSITLHNGLFVLSQEFYEIAARDVANLGKPYCQTATPSSLSGYMTVSNAHVAISGTSAEASMINAYMEAGFYYE